MKKVIYSAFSDPFWFEVADHLLERHDWQPIYWVGYTGDLDLKSLVEQRYPGIIFHPYIDAVKSIPATYFSGKRLVPLDQQLLSKLASSEKITLKMMDRMDALDSFGYHERIRHYYRLLRYWSTVLDGITPDIVLFKDIPHVVYDYVLYELCRLRGIETIMFHVSNLRRIWIITDQIFGENEVIARYRQILASPPDQEVDLSPSSEQYLKSFQASEYESIPRFVRFVERADYRAESQVKNLFQKIFDFRNYGQYYHKNLAVFQSKIKPPLNYLKVAGKTPEESSMSWFQHRRFIAGSRKKMRHLASYYENLTREVDFQRPFVYVALTFQPEANSSPKGGLFGDVRLMVDLLAACIPKDWVVYVKEHPSQLHPNWAFRAQAARSEGFYDDLVKIPKVQLVPMATSPYALIDQARAVATLTGTSGFQAVNRGKPALIFGFPWYKGCEGVFHIQAQQDCLQAIEKIQTGITIDPLKIRLFIQALEQVGVSNYIEDKWQHFFEQTNNPQAMADKIYGFYQRLSVKI
jgi:hypothetical protein